MLIINVIALEFQSVTFGIIRIGRHNNNCNRIHYFILKTGTPFTPGYFWWFSFWGAYSKTNRH
jgi:hypothetical protein